MDSGPEVYFQIIILILLTLVNAFFAASEMAIVSMDKKKLLTLSEQGDKRAIKVEKLLKEPSKFLSLLQDSLHQLLLLWDFRISLGIF